MDPGTRSLGELLQERWGGPTFVATHPSDASARLCVKLGLRQYAATDEVREGEIGSIFAEIKNLVEPIESRTASEIFAASAASDSNSQINISHGLTREIAGSASRRAAPARAYWQLEFKATGVANWTALMKPQN